MNKKYFWQIIFVSLFIVAVLYAYYNNLPTIIVTTAQNGTIQQSIEEPGYVRAGQFFEIQAPGNGEIIRLDVITGQLVKAGQTLMLLKNLNTETQLASTGNNINAAMAERDNSSAIIRIAQTDYEEAKRDLKRKKALLDGGNIAQAEYDIAENNVQKAKDTIISLQESLKSAEHRLGSLQSQQKGLSSQVKQLVITSPIDAQILDLPVKKGQILTTGTLLTKVGTPNRLDVYCEILSEDAVKVLPSQFAEVRIGGDKKQFLKGRIKEIYPQAYERISALGVIQRRVPVIVTLDDNGPLQPGYEVKLIIHTASRENVLTVPREALVSSASGEETIRVVESGQIAIRQVQVGLKNQFQAEITKGLKHGDMIVLDGSSHLKNGTRIKTIKASL